MDINETGLVFHPANFNELTRDESVIFENVGTESLAPGNSCVIYPGGKVYLEEENSNEAKDVPSMLDETIKSINLGKTGGTSQEKLITLIVSNFK